METKPVKTVTICIGNSDNKLTQEEWSLFCNRLKAYIYGTFEKIYFEGYSKGDAPQQNACWVIGVPKREIHLLQWSVSNIRKDFKQDSAATIVGETEFV